MRHVLDGIISRISCGSSAILALLDIKSTSLYINALFGCFRLYWDLQVQKKTLPADDGKHNFAARVVAESMKAVNVRVTSSAEIGGGFRVEPSPAFDHKNLYLTVQGIKSKSWNMQEHLHEICGQPAIV